MAFHRFQVVANPNMTNTNRQPEIEMAKMPPLKRSAWWNEKGSKWRSGVRERHQSAYARWRGAGASTLLARQAMGASTWRRGTPCEGRQHRDVSAPRPAGHDMIRGLYSAQPIHSNLCIPAKRRVAKHKEGSSGDIASLPSLDQDVDHVMEPRRCRARFASVSSDALRRPGRGDRLPFDVQLAEIDSTTKPILLPVYKPAQLAPRSKKRDQ